MQIRGVIHRDIKNANILITIPKETLGLYAIDPVFDQFNTQELVHIIQNMLNNGTEIDNY